MLFLARNSNPRPISCTWIPIQGKLVVIFSQFKIMLDQLANYLDMSGFPFERLDGDTSSDDRQRSIDKFQNTNGEKGASQVLNQDHFVC